MEIPLSEHVHAGYQHDLHEYHIINLDHLRDFPSDSEISADLTNAQKLSLSLSEFGGMIASEIKEVENEIQAIFTSTIDIVEEDYIGK